MDENIDKAIIFEDDCVPSNGFSNKIEEIIEELPHDFNIVWLGGVHCADYISSENIDLSNNISIKKENRNYCTFSYIISYNGAKAFYNHSMDNFRGHQGVDTFMFESMIYYSITQHVASPMICHSQINNDTNSIFCTDIQEE